MVVLVQFHWLVCCFLTLLHSERPKLNGVLAVLSAVGLIKVPSKAVEMNSCVSRSVNTTLEQLLYYNGSSSNQITAS